MRPNVIIRAAAGIARWRTLRTLAAFEAVLPQATAVQDRVLAELVAASADSKFGRDFGLCGIRTYADFAARVPILDYDRLAPYIEPIKRGDVTSLFNPGTKVHMFALTSGTTGAVKFLPVTARYLANHHRAWNAWGIACYRDHMAAWLRPILQITSPMDEQRTASGLPCGAISGFIHHHQLRIVKRFYVLPACVGYIKDARAKCYTIMRLAMVRDVGMIATANPSTPLQLAQTAELHAESLIRDVRDGTLRGDLDMPPEIRQEVTALLKADPETASRLDRLASSHGRLLPKHYWRPGFMTNWTGGTLGLYLRQFPEYFGDAPVRDLGLIASEGRMTMPLTDGTPAGVLEIFGNFYEFVPADEMDSKSPTVLRCHELAAGRDYFILLTTAGGLFRYNIGDVVRCEGFAAGGGSQAPILSFLNKGRHTSSITGEKLTEHQVVAAVGRASASMRLGGGTGGLSASEGTGGQAARGTHRTGHERLLDAFVLCPRWGNPPFYALNIEQSTCPPERFAELADALDGELAGANVEYAQKRTSGRLGRIVVAPVVDGFFDKLAEQRLRERGTRREQYKHQFLYVAVDADKEFPRV